MEQDNGGSKKRKVTEEDDVAKTTLDNNAPATDSSLLKRNNRNERKRQLEKKRRDEVNNGLDKMMELLFEIDPKSRAESRERQIGSQDGGDSMKYNSLHALNRVDLIQRSTELLRNLHYENQDLKKMIAELTGNQPSATTVRITTQRAFSSTQCYSFPQTTTSQLPPRLSANSFPMPTQNPERSESAPVSVLNALREERQALIDKQRSIDASLELYRSRLSLPSATSGPRREVSLDFGTNSLHRQAAAARREEEIRLALGMGSSTDRPTAAAAAASTTNDAGDPSQALANLRKNRDDLLEEASEPSSHHREDAFAGQAYLPNSVGGNNALSEKEELLALLRKSEMANRELLMSGSRLGDLDRHHHQSGDNRFLMLQNQQRRAMVERLAMDARMPNSLARSRTLDPALLLQHHRNNGNGGSGGKSQHRMF